jgi:hypothetical protein
MNINALEKLPSSQREKLQNEKLYKRNIPSKMLQPYLDARPVLTKYSIMPIVDPRKEINEPFRQEPTYNLKHTFNPGNDMAPWSGYASNVNHESDLRNQIYALQKCDQSVYVPSSKSSLYQCKWENKNVQVSQPFPGLFEKESFCMFNPNPNAEKIGFSLFNNATRQQIKDI